MSKQEQNKLVLLAPEPTAPSEPTAEENVALPNTDPIKLADDAEALLATPKTVVVEDAPTEIDPNVYREATNENDKRVFIDKVLAARAPVVEPAVPQPVAPRVLDQTLAEQEAGRRAVAKHEEHYAKHPMPRHEQDKSTAVFRPADYVPNQRKGQGNVQARPV